MKPSYEVLHAETLTLAVEKDDGDYYRFGTLTWTIQSDGRQVYIIQIDEDKYPTALSLAKSEMFPGFNPKHGWYQRHDKLIPFIYERTYDPKRQDLEEMLIPWGMSKKDYTRWNCLKITKGIHRDKWRCLFEQ
ncbi:MAG: hypothetical protein FWG64_11825 [Firmicutes bacterium]|nr:hypothetical protein [Bacillota bacterium]